MRHAPFALVSLLAAAALGAQCGTNTLVTPPNFANSAGGAVGNAVYFSLSAEPNAGNGVSICAIDVHASRPAGAPLQAIVYRHLTLTGYALLDPLTLGAANWCPIATASGTANGVGTGSRLDLSVPVDLPPGSQQLLAVRGLDFAQQYTVGNGANQAVTDGNLRFDGGTASNVPFTNPLFQPRVFNGRFHYDLPAAPVTATACGAVATCEVVGQGCGGDPGQLFEEFASGAFDLVDLASQSSQDLLVSLSGGQAIASVVPGTPIVPPVAPDLQLDDEANSPLLPLGFALGDLCVEAISVASNGYVWLGALGSADFSPSASEFVNQGARLAVCWTDLDPSAGGSIHVDVAPNLVRVTYLAVFPFGGAAPAVTAQVELAPGSIRVRYDPAGGDFAAASLVGLTNGVPPASWAPVDLTGGALPIVAAGVDLGLGCAEPLRLGAAGVLTTTGLEPAGLGATVASLGAALSPGVPVPQATAGCLQFVGPAIVPLALFGGGACTATLSLPVPNDPGLRGLTLTLQSASLGSRVLTSNAIEAVVGDV